MFLCLLPPAFLTCSFVLSCSVLSLKGAGFDPPVIFNVLVHLSFKVNPLLCDAISRICLVAIALTLLGGQPFALDIKNLPDAGGTVIKEAVLPR